MRRFPELAALSQAEVPEVMFSKLFGAIYAPEMLEGMLAATAEWRPDLVVADGAELAGHIVAADVGVPCVTKGFGPLLPERRLALAAEEVAPLWRSRGLEPRPYCGCYDTLYIDSYPPALQAEAADHIPRRTFLRPGRDDGDVDAAAPLPLPAGSPDDPLVYVTMGTVFNEPRQLRVCADALQGLRVRADGDPVVLGAQPEHVRVERYVPQSAVLQHCAVVISHAGSGTVLGAAALGLPQLCIPQGADQFLNARSITASGAGLTLMPGESTAQSVADAVMRLLDDGAFRDAAARVRASIESMPDVDEVATLLETLG
jgi:UDP:flavonoid glycosyltransferase YjiC (YdhE family)